MGLVESKNDKVEKPSALDILKSNLDIETVLSDGIKDINTVEIISQEDSYGKTKLQLYRKSNKYKFIK